MTMTYDNPVLAEAILPGASIGSPVRQFFLIAFGVIFLAMSAKVAVPMWPVPVTMGTFVVLSLGVAYGPRLGLATITGYLLLGALGFDVFAGSSNTDGGIAYMVGPTGGYLLGYAIAVLVIGSTARLGWDRTHSGMALAMLLGNIAIYVPGLLWLGFLLGWAKPILDWGLKPFLIGDALKLALAALLVPPTWKLATSAKR